jgi:hypothetical protein
MTPKNWCRRAGAAGAKGFRPIDGWHGMGSIGSSENRPSPKNIVPVSANHFLRCSTEPVFPRRRYPEARKRHGLSTGSDRPFQPDPGGDKTSQPDETNQPENSEACRLVKFIDTKSPQAERVAYFSRGIVLIFINYIL